MQGVTTRPPEPFWGARVPPWLVGVPGTAQPLTPVGRGAALWPCLGLSSLGVFVFSPRNVFSVNEEQDFVLFGVSCSWRAHAGGAASPALGGAKGF